VTDILDAPIAAPGPLHADALEREPSTAPPAAPLAIDAVVATKVSFATQQNAVPVLKELRLVNLTDTPMERLRLEVEADPPVFAAHTWRFDRLGPSAEAGVRERDLHLKAAYLQQLSEAVRATVTLRASEDREGAPVLAERRFPVDILARTEWGGAGAQPELLAAFVTPNDPAINRILKRASEVLARSGKRDALDGYQARSRERAYELASAVWSAVAGLRLTYAEPPASFELQGQKVRTPSAVLEAELATCLDTTLLFAAALEQSGLYPVLVLTKGHAFAGVWLQPQEFATLLVEDASVLRKRLGLKELVLFETTLATGSSPANFARAVAEGERKVAEEVEADFVLALDVRRARLQRIRPLALADAAPGAPHLPDEAPPAPDVERLDEAPQLGGFDLVDPDPAPTTPEGRLRRWQRKLLNLSTNNNPLLHVQPGRSALQLLCPEPGRLEDRLADGASFRIAPLPQMEGAAGRDAALHTQRTGEVLDVAYARDALERGEVLCAAAPDKLDAQLTELYRKARLDLAEGGANTLYLAIGVLCWKKTASDTKSYRAPLILIPVQLERKSVRSGVKLKAYDDEPRFNLTLLQMLKQDFRLDIPELAGTLPRDDSGVDVGRILTLVRKAVRDTPGFEVADDVLLGAFSFAKYLMWKDLADRSEALLANPVVRHLIETPRERYVGACEPPAPERLDEEVSPGELFTPLPADSSQLAAVVGSARGCDFVLDGPPGTGKSQTIANMIAHNLALGRRVLFVAEKRAALDVVYRRLEAHGLGPFCLELHSNKAAKGDVIAQLDRAWSTREGLDDGEWNRRAAELKAARDQLNRLVQALHRRHPNGMTLHQAIGRLVRDGKAGAVRLGWPDRLSHGAGQMEALRAAAHRLDVHYRPEPGPAATALAAIGQGAWSPRWQSDLLAAAGELVRAAEAAATARARYEDRLGARLDGDRRGLAALAGLSAALDSVAGLDVGFAFAPDAARIMAATREALATLAEYRAEAATLSRPLDPKRLRELDLAALKRDWAAAKAAIWPLSIFKTKEVARRFDPASAADLDADLPRTVRLQPLLAKLDATPAGLPGWAGLETDAVAVEHTLQAADALRQTVASAAETPEQLGELRSALRRLCADGGELIASEGAVGRAGAAWREAHDAFLAALDAFESLAAPPAPIDAPDLLAHARTLGESAPAASGQLNAWCAWRRAEREAQDLQLGVLVTALAQGAVAPGGAGEAFELAYARWWAEATAEAEPAIRDFNLADQTDAVSRFRALDDEFARLTQAYIRARLSGQIPLKAAQDRTPGMQALAAQIAHPKSRRRLRELIADMGRDLTTLTPCLLMSPLSVAQYLPPDAALFDLVIFDEASQIAPWDAVGAIARGRQLVVAGDPKQMPPTSFFEKGSTSDAADDGAVGEDQESILDECISASLPERRLTWHYRSRSESLIAFSNHRYYDGDLITFPAPLVKDDAVSFRQVEGVWARGKARNNPVEAKAIAEEVVRRLKDPDFKDEAGRALTLLVITLNAEQQKLVEDLLDKARQADPSLEPFFDDALAEPVLVRNLETVQGDERDVILLGIGYGPDAPGATTMAMNFGPLNRQGGGRRLNVAVTRARREMVVFASFPPGLIDLNRTSAEAVRDLKHFLEFAERGPRALGEAVAGSVGGYDSPFEQAVARALRDRGWTVVPQIGVSRFRIDLGVVHPDRPGDYLCGVECDGASYHSAATARDRDKVREAVLKGLGWSLVRVWSTDWWTDPQGALDRICGALDAELARSRAAAEAKALAQAAARAGADPPAIYREAPSPPDDAPANDLRNGNLPDGDFPVAPEPVFLQAAEPDAPPAWAPGPQGDYQLAAFDDWSGRIEPARFQEPAYSPTLREMIARVIAQEAPIRDDALVERIARAHGIRRSGRLVRERVLSLASGSAHLGTEPGGDAVFVWPDAGLAESWSRARYPASESDIRPLEEIALAELGAALRACSAEDPETEVARRFGIRRLSAAGRQRLARARSALGHFAV
jgi:very-short-patch-repair endonuclease